jgi:hypothetical protein
MAQKVLPYDAPYTLLDCLQRVSGLKSLVGLGTQTVWGSDTSKAAAVICLLNKTHL